MLQSQQRSILLFGVEISIRTPLTPKFLLLSHILWLDFYLKRPNKSPKIEGLNR